MTGPSDSHEAYEIGLRAPRCNGCRFDKLKYELGDKCYIYRDPWVNVYELDAEPIPGQGQPQSFEGRPLKWRASFMAVGHSDECYNWQPPNKEAD